VLDVEKQALLVLAHGLSACGDHHSILTFASRRHSWVRVETVKSFEEPMGAAVERRIGALKPGYYTRIGPAVRHAAAELARQPQRKKLLLVLTDGKPNDVGHYEGRLRSRIRARRCGRPGGRASRCSALPSTPALNPTFPRYSGAAAMPSSATSVACRRRCRRYTGNWRDETGQNLSIELQISINR
jgi:hypothetical protein